MDEDKSLDLSVEICGIRLKNPLLVCSGTYGNGREYAQWLDPERLGGLMTKSVTLKACEGNPPPRIWETPYGMINAIGLENRGLGAFLEQDLPWLSSLDLAVWVNVAGFSAREYAVVAGEVSRSGMADAIELNISCPNVKEGGIYFSSAPREAAALVDKVRREVDVPLFVKLTPRCSDIVGMARAVAAAGADGLSLINTFPAMAVDVETATPCLANVTGGLSGPAIHPIAVLMVWEVAQALQLPVIGMGGIWTWKDAVEMMMVGADAFAVGTLNFMDPTAPLEILEGMSAFMRRKGLGSVSQLVGMAQRGYGQV